MAAAFGLELPAGRPGLVATFMSKPSDPGSGTAGPLLLPDFGAVPSPAGAASRLIGKVDWHLAHLSLAPPGGIRLSSML
jgi:hypothetical protein